MTEILAWKMWNWMLHIGDEWETISQHKSEKAKQWNHFRIGTHIDFFFDLKSSYSEHVNDCLTVNRSILCAFGYRQLNKELAQTIGIKGHIAGDDVERIEFGAIFSKKFFIITGNWSLTLKWNFLYHSHYLYAKTYNIPPIHLHLIPFPCQYWVY